jgi:hypothetical protein
MSKARKRKNKKKKARFSELYEGSFAVDTKLRPTEGAIVVCVDENLTRQLVKAWWAEISAKPHSNFTLPTAVEFMLVLLSRQRRNDVLNDIMDWYPGWIKKYGHIGAHCACWWKIGSAALHGLLDLAERVGEIVGKFRGAK